MVVCTGDLSKDAPGELGLEILDQMQAGHHQVILC